ncbi:MAG: DUF3857 domain-containing protein [Bryobacteraceae bacterium]
MRATGVLVCAMALVAADDAPQWLRDLAAMQVPAQPAKAPAVVLLDEQSTTVDDSGVAVHRRQKAMKILTNEGRREAVAADAYYAKGGKVRDIRAWTILPDGRTIRYGKEKAVERARVDGYSLYNDMKVVTISGSADANPGAVFGFELVSEEKTVFTQFRWNFQDDLPTLISRFRLTLPPGWETKSAMLRHTGVEPQVSGNTSTWELRDLPYRESEPSGPSIASVVPTLEVGYVPSAGARAQGKVLRNWGEVSSWMVELADPAAVPNDAISAKARELTAGAATEWDKIRSLGRYAQNVRYVAIQTNSARGGGYVPHAAADVFTNNYGDCKDKAALLRALLKAVGVDSYDVSIYSGDRTRVDEKWASPFQFNHAIAAIKVSDAVKSDAVVEVAGAGRLLIFDPTDESTPMGHLPTSEQGSLALIAIPGKSALVTMPVLPVSANRTERVLRYKLDEEGTVTGTLEEKSAGAQGARVRQLHKELDKDTFRKAVERRVASIGPNTKVSQFTADDSNDVFSLKLDFAAERFGKRMNPRLLVVKPTVIPHQVGPNVSESKRQRPVLLNAQSMVETIEAELPAGFTVDEAPENLKLDTPYGTIVTDFAAEAGKLRMRREITLKHVNVPVGEYAKLREFLQTVAGHQSSPVVLLKK